MGSIKNNLYVVTLASMVDRTVGISYGKSYVVAEDVEQAYQKVKSFLETNKIGTPSDRVLYRIELLASTDIYSGIKNILFT